MKTSFAWTVAVMVTMSSIGCTGRPLRNVLHRGAPCGAAAAAPAVTLPVVSDVTSYMPTCGWAAPSCPTCSTTPGLPVMIDGGYPVDGAVIMPEPLP